MNFQTNQKNSSGSTQDPPLTIGYLINTIEPNFHFLEWSGVYDVANQNEVNLFCFRGQALSPDHPANIVYEFVGPENVAGIVVSSGLFALKGEASFFQRFKTLPKTLVNINNIPEIPSIVIDNEKGFRNLLIHLIEEHGCKHIAHIKGTAGKVATEERYKIYCQVLAEYHIPLDENLVVPGIFHLPSSGEDAIKILIDDRKMQFDAVVSANDDMAIGAVAELQSRGIRIPEEIIVTGFDDWNYGKSMTPPLTTVTQRVDLQGRTATKLLLQMLHGEEVPKQILLPTELIVRNSCGCLSQLVQETRLRIFKNNTTEKDGYQEWPEDVLLQIVAAMREINLPISLEWLKNLVTVLQSDIQDHSGIVSLSVLRDTIRRSINNGCKDINIWQRFISVMQEYSYNNYETRTEFINATNLWHKARIMIGELAVQVESQNRIENHQNIDILSHIYRTIGSTFYLTQILDSLFQELTMLHIENSYLALYEKNEGPIEQARLILAYQENQKITLEPKGLSFPVHQIVPPPIYFLKTNGFH